MNCRTAKYRLHVAQFWFERIQNNYLDPNETVEYYLEAFLMSCRSVTDYVVRDFLDSIKPNLTLENKLLINWKKNEFVQGRRQLPAHEKNNLILKFLKEYDKAYKELTDNLLVKYFFTKRNVITHHSFSGIYDKTYDESDNIISRRFETQAMSILLENGSHLLAEGDSKILLEDNNRIPIEDFVLSRIDEKQKQQLMDLVVNKEAIGLLRDFFAQINQFVEKFESDDVFEAN